MLSSLYSTEYSGIEDSFSLLGRTFLVDVPPSPSRSGGQGSTRFTSPLGECQYLGRFMPTNVKHATTVSFLRDFTDLEVIVSDLPNRELNSTADIKGIRRLLCLKVKRNSYFL